MKKQVKKRGKQKNYSGGTFAITFLAVVCFISLFLPLVSGEYSVSVADAIKGKIVDGTTVLTKMGIFGIASSVTVFLPLLAVFIISFCAIDRIQKYVVSFFLSIVLLVGYMIVYYMMSSKFDGKAAFGFYLELVLILALLFTPIYSMRKDPAGRKYKATVWYKGISKIILLVCLPLAAAMIVFAVMMFDLLSNMPVSTSIGVFLIIAGTVIAAVVSVFTVFENYKSGLLYFITGACWSVGIVFCMARAGFGVLLAAIAVAAVFAIFWMSLGAISQKYF